MSNYERDELERVARVFQALGNPNRLQILLRLVDCCGPGESCTKDQIGAFVGELGRDLGIAPSTVSHHIRELHQSGLIRMERRGRNIACRPAPEILRTLAEFLGQPDACCSELAQLSAQAHRKE
jgi:ArsR family transcriptional regulator